MKVKLLIIFIFFTYFNSLNFSFSKENKILFKVNNEIITSIVNSTAQSMGGSAIVDIRKGYPFLMNNEEITIKSISNAKEFLGEQNVIDLDLRMTAEDFAYYSQQIPGCFYRLGTGESTGLHTSTFNINEAALETSIGFMAYNAIKQLNS